LGEGRTYRVDDAVIAVFRARGERLFAVQATCPHRGGPLADGIVGDGKVVCPLHGHTFDLATGQSDRGGCPALRTYPVAVTPHGEVVVQT
ncbi:MAG TPA: Rieske 2Fe-2S domain-containing protein, partial [Gemmatimonadales bacterium]|nr:Rieske 2Fe-2S domain-containing protein [Gemmatimonadales bacterium]